MPDAVAGPDAAGEAGGEQIAPGGGLPIVIGRCKYRLPEIKSGKNRAYINKVLSLDGIWAAKQKRST